MNDLSFILVLVFYKSGHLNDLSLEMTQFSCVPRLVVAHDVDNCLVSREMGTRSLISLVSLFYCKKWKIATSLSYLKSN